MDAPASDYIAVDLVARHEMVPSLLRNFGRLVANLVLAGYGPDLGVALVVRVQSRVTGRVLAQYEYDSDESNAAPAHVARLEQQMAEMSATDFCRDLGIELQTDEGPA